MFQAFFRRSLTNNGGTSAVLQFSRFNSTVKSGFGPKQNRNVKLIGTIHKEPLLLSDGSKVLTIKTVHDNHFKLHRTVVRSPKILSVIGNNLSVGQRVFISGELRVTNFLNNENQHRQLFQTHVTELYASKLSDNDMKSSESSEESDNAKPKKNFDHNSVFLLANIVSDIQHNENNTRFLVASNITPSRNPTDDQIATYIGVYVHDIELRKLVNNLQKGNRVLINGSLGSKSETDQNGQKKPSGHIEATNILKVDRFDAAFNENTADESINTAN